MRDHRKLEVFHAADDLVMNVYRATASFPDAERYGIISQIRRASVSVPCNIVEGCARAGEREYVHFLRLAHGSLREVGYLIGLSNRLGYVPSATHEALSHQYDQCARQLAALIKAVTASNTRSSAG